MYNNIGTVVVERRQALTTIRNNGNCLVCDTAKGGLRITYIAPVETALPIPRASYEVPRIAVPKATRKSFVTIVKGYVDLVNVSSDIKLSDFSRGGLRYEEFVTLISDVAGVDPTSVRISSGEDEYNSFEALTRRNQGQIRLAYEIYDHDVIHNLTDLNVLSLLSEQNDVNVISSNVTITNRTIYESTLDAEDVKLSLENECCCQDKPVGFCTYFLCASVCV